MSIKSGSGISAGTSTSEDEVVLSFSDLLRVMWRRGWLIVLLALILTGLAVGGSLVLQPPTYEAYIEILVGQAQQSSTNQGNLGGEVQGLQDLTGTVTELVKSRSVAEAVIQKLHLHMDPETLLNNLDAEQKPNTLLVEVSYRDTDPERAQKIANAVGEEFSKRLPQINPSANTIVASVAEQAVVPESPVSPKPLRNGFLGLVLGAMLGIGLAFLLENLDDSWRSPEEVEQISGVPTFGVVPEFWIPKSKEKK
jgi:capsular polysaccharide biosynthesis protein